MLTLRPMLASDLDKVLAIESKSFDRGWSRQQFLDELVHDGHACVACRGDVLVGYICLHWVLDEAEILNLAVCPSGRRLGVGASLLCWALQQAVAAGARLMHLEVRETSLPAVALYQQNGFVVTGRRPGYYPQNTTALIMTRPLA